MSHRYGGFLYDLSHRECQRYPGKHIFNNKQLALLDVTAQTNRIFRATVFQSPSLQNDLNRCALDFCITKFP